MRYGRKGRVKDQEKTRKEPSGQVGRYQWETSIRKRCGDRADEVGKGPRVAGEGCQVKKTFGRIKGRRPKGACNSGHKGKGQYGRGGGEGKMKEKGYIEEDNT